MEAANKGFTTNCSLVKCFAQSLELFKMKKLILKPDAEPTLFDFSKTINKEVSTEEIGKRTVWRKSLEGFTTNCSLVKCFAQSLELFDGTESFLFTLIVHSLRRLSSLGNSNIPIPWPDLVFILE
jgi:hypothetical protein